MEFAKICKEKGGGFVDYLWPKPGESQPVPKISYVKLYEPWGWVVGSGIYIDDLYKQMRLIKLILLGGDIAFAVFHPDNLHPDKPTGDNPGRSRWLTWRTILRMVKGT